MTLHRSARRAALLLALAVAHAAQAADSANLEVVHRIKAEAFLNSRVMDYLHLLADENGPRVSGSPGYRRAAEAAVAAFKEGGVDGAQLESWGTFGRGWSWSRVAVQMKTPQATTLSAYPADWSPGTEGAVEGEVVFAPMWEEGESQSTDDLVKYAERIESWKNAQRGKLRGKVVMIDWPVDFALPSEPPKYRHDAQTLNSLPGSPYVNVIEPGPVPKLTWPLVRMPVDKDELPRLSEVMPLEFAADRWDLQTRLQNRIAAFLTEEGAAAVLLASGASVAGVIMHSDYGSWRDGDPVPPPTVALMAEQYGRIHRLLQRKVPVTLALEVDAQFHPQAEGLNVIAELPGSARGAEVVMLGAHLDSWHGATGASDNAAGSAVVMEAMRILAKLDLPMKRSVRAALWDGEEQCLCGSRAYVKKHFADPVTMALGPEHAKLSVYFNLDGGAGRIRGVFLQQNDMAGPLLSAWLAPFAELGVTASTLATSTGSDHLSFNAVGLPIIDFVQDPLDYYLNLHHSNVDDVGHVLPGDLMQAAAVMASTVYHAATREERMPRKALPKPLPPRGELPAILR